MRHVLLFSWLAVFVIPTMEAQDLSFSVNYMYLGARGKYAYHVPKELDSHGMGIQGKIHLKNRFYLMPDAGYFFDRYSEEVYDEVRNNWAKSYIRHYVANVNMTYDVRLSKSFSLLPFAGAGFLYEYTQQRGHSDGYPNIGGAPFDVIETYDYPGIIINGGISLEGRLTEHLFLTAGLKYMFDVYDAGYNAFPCINAGIGYHF